MNDKLIKARAVAVTGKILKCDECGRATLFTPGAGSKYLITLDWGVETVSTTCTCPGSNRGICYHQIGAAVKALEVLGGKIAVGEYKGNMKRLGRMGGKLWRVDGYGVVWMLARGVKYKKGDRVEKELPGELRECLT